MLKSEMLQALSYKGHTDFMCEIIITRGMDSLFSKCDISCLFYVLKISIGKIWFNI